MAEFPHHNHSHRKSSPVNPFSPKELEKYKKFFQPQARPNVLGTPKGLAAVEAEQAGLASFLGGTDYGKQLEEAQNLSKLQLALALAQRGFAAAGATPQRGEAPISTLSRELFAPVAGDAGAVAANLMKQKQALQAAERQEERQLKLSALQNVQQREQQAFEDDATATERARQFMQNILKKGDTVSNDYLVEGKNVPLIVRKDYTAKVQGLYSLDGDKIDNTKVKVKPEATATVKPITSWLNDVQVKPVGSSDDQFRDAPGALRIADGTGEKSRVVLDNTTLDFDPNSKTYNARIVKKKSDQSAFYPPKSKSVFLSQPAIELYDLPKNLVGQKATYREYLVKPERRGPNSQSIKELSVAGKTFVFNQHSGYNPATGNITVERGPGEPPVTYEATQLFREEDPKAYVDVGDPLTVPPGSRLAEIRKIKGLSQITPNEKLRLQRNAAGEERILYGRQTITLSDAEAALFQAKGLSAAQQRQAGQTVEEFKSTGKELTVGPTNLDKLRLIPGLENVKPNEKIELLSIEGDPALGIPTQFQYRYGGNIVNIPSSVLQSGALLTRALSEPEKLEAGQTFRTFNKTGELVIPPGKTNLIPGSAVGEKVMVEEDQAGNVRYTYKGELLSNEVGVQFLARPLSESERVKARLVLEPRQLYVNTSDRSLTVGGQTIGPGQTGAFSKTDINTDAFLNVSGSFREVGPVSTDTKTYMVIGVEPTTIDGVQYAPGDEARFSPQEFNNLSADVKKFFTEDRELRSAQVKKNYFKNLWKDVTERENLTARPIKEQDLQTLLAMFPAGMRSGGKNLREEVFSMIKYGANANQGAGPTPSSASASASAQSYADSVQAQLRSAKTRYDRFVARGALNVPWDSLSFERKRAFADLPKTVQIANIADAWEKAEGRLATAKAAIKPVKPEDAAAFSSAVELLILAKRLRDGQELDKTGRFFVGTLGSLGANIFADVDFLTSGGSRRLQQIINRMKASYATLSEVEGGGKDSVFRQQLQAELIPSFTKAENLNRDNLNSIINRLETNIRSIFNQEIQTSNVVPKTFEIMAKEAGITGVSVDPKRYRWLDPNVQETPPVTRQRVMEGINMIPATFEDAKDLRVGRILPLVAPNAPNTRYVKLKDLANGEVLIQEARSDGKPKAGSPKLILSTDMKTRLQ